MRVRDGSGPPCARCGYMMIAWKHDPAWVPRPGRQYYGRWYECLNRSCPTRQVMPEEYRVVREGARDRVPPPDPANPFVDLMKHFSASDVTPHVGQRLGVSTGFAAHDLGCRWTGDQSGVNN
jgi:hypothetical protein